MGSFSTRCMIMKKFFTGPVGSIIRELFTGNEVTGIEGVWTLQRQMVSIFGSFVKRPLSIISVSVQFGMDNILDDLLTGLTSVTVILIIIISLFSHLSLAAGKRVRMQQLAMWVEKFRVEMSRLTALSKQHGYHRVLCSLSETWKCAVAK